MQIQQLCTVNTFTRLTIKSKHIKLIVCFEHNRILQCQWEKEVDIFVFIINFLDQRELLEWVWMTSKSVVMQKKSIFSHLGTFSFFFQQGIMFWDTWHHAPNWYTTCYKHLCRCVLCDLYVGTYPMSLNLPLYSIYIFYHYIL